MGGVFRIERSYPAARKELEEIIGLTMLALEEVRDLKDQKNKGALGILSLVLWAVLLTVIARLLTHRSGWDFSGILFKVLLWVMLCIAVFFCWWIFAGLRLNKFLKRLDEAGYTYLKTHDTDAYLLEMDACCEMPGVKNSVISGIPAKDYVVILKIRTLREAGRREEALTLLEAAQREMKGEKAQLLIKAEKEKFERR